MTIKAKILSLVAAFALLAVAITALGLKTMADYDHIIAGYNRASELAFRGERLNRYLTAVAVDIRGVFMARNPDEGRWTADRVDESVDTLTRFMGDWKAQLRPGELPEFNAVNGQVQQFALSSHTLADIARNQSLKAAADYGFHYKNLVFRQQMQASVDAMVTRIGTDQGQSRSAMEHFRSERRTQFVLIAASGILLLLAGSLWIVIGAIATPLGRVRQSMIRISEGAYDTPLPSEAQSEAMGTEIGQLWRALGILKSHAQEAERLAQEKLRHEQSLRELVLD